MEKWKILTNKFLYIPSAKILITNSIILICVVLLAVVYHFVPEPVKDFLEQVTSWNKSITSTIVILLLGLIIGVAFVFLGIDKYFVHSYQGLRAALGTAVFMTIVYSVIWGLMEIARGNQSLVVFRPQHWSLLYTLMNLRTGSLLLWFSSLSLLKLPFSLGEEGHDFGPWRKDWELWKRSARKLSKHVPLTHEEHVRLLELDQSLLQGLRSRGAYIQPVAEFAAKRTEVSLDLFSRWYREKTAVTYADCTGPDARIEPVVRGLLRPWKAGC